MTEAIPLEFVESHHRIPETVVADLYSFKPSRDLGVSKYASVLQNNGTLRALLVNKGSDVLVVALHGATNRAKKALPRFEWFRTLRVEEYSSMYFSDPLLEVDPTLGLAWYTGRLSLDLHVEMAKWIVKAASAVGASQVVILGSSGGGFAALQIASHIKGSLALPFSPQTAIANYRGGGTGFGAQRKYLKVVMPELAPELALEKLDGGLDWSEPISERLSALSRYRQPQCNYVYYVQNENDFPHVEQHYKLFREVIFNSPNRDRVCFDLYEGPQEHNPPPPKEFRRALYSAINWHGAKR